MYAKFQNKLETVFVIQCLGRALRDESQKEKIIDPHKPSWPVPRKNKKDNFR